MTLTKEQPELERPIESDAQLIDYFRSAETPVQNWRFGTEHEKLGLYSDSYAPVRYDGERGIRALFEKLIANHDFKPLVQGEFVVGLERGDIRITLEPGGALELAGAPLETLHETCKEFQDHIALMKHVSAEFGIEWLGLGVQPFASLAEIPHMPSERYDIMRRLLSGLGDLALEMMHMTGGVQTSIDFSTEADAARKLRIALAASPIVTALYANSSISEGRANGFESRRAWVWRHTDPARCGFPPVIFGEEWLEGDAYRLYTEWALDVPMWFAIREGRHVEISGQTFRDFLRAPPREVPEPRMTDWALHLTTLFPEVRLKRVIELRGADAVPPDLVCGMPAIWKGLLYDPESQQAALDRLRHWTQPQVDSLHADVARVGLQAATPDGPLLEVARELVDLARAGLKRIDARSKTGRDETLFLDPVYETLDRGVSPGRQLLERWEGSWRQRKDLLVEYAKY